MTSRKNVAFIAGATGVVGARLIQELAQSDEWRVIGCSRKPPSPAARVPNVDYVTLDLADAEACPKVAAELQGVTHLFYAGRATFTTGVHEAVDLNTLMFRNILDALETAHHPLEHVHMVHGTKYYGSTEGPFPVPAREDGVRSNLHTFYYEQEDIVRARTGTRRWSWTATRPHAICESSRTTPRSLPLLIATYAAICRQLGEPLNFPGTDANYHALYQCTDAGLLARAIKWMSTEPRCADQAFNVTNGDVFRWRDMWPSFARDFGMEAGGVRTMTMADVMPQRAGVWRRAVASFGLADTAYERMALWSYGDFIFTSGWDMVFSTEKLRQFGFHETLDTREMFSSFFNDFRRANVIPTATGRKSTSHHVS